MGLIEGIFDGACEPTNPGGHAAWGAVVKIDGKVEWTSSGYCGVGKAMSNNVAEYSGCLAVLEHVKAIPGSLIIRGDSKLVIEQLSGRWRTNCTACGKSLMSRCRCATPRPGLYYPIYLKARAALGEQVDFRKGNVRLKWVPREENADCDYLSKEELHKRGVRFRIQTETPQAATLQPEETR